MPTNAKKIDFFDTKAGYRYQLQDIVMELEVAPRSPSWCWERDALQELLVRLQKPCYNNEGEAITIDHQDVDEFAQDTLAMLSRSAGGNEGDDIKLAAYECFIRYMTIWIKVRWYEETALADELTELATSTTAAINDFYEYEKGGCASTCRPGHVGYNGGDVPSVSSIRSALSRRRSTKIDLHGSESSETTLCIRTTPKI